MQHALIIDIGVNACKTLRSEKEKLKHLPHYRLYKFPPMKSSHKFHFSKRYNVAAFPLTLQLASLINETHKRIYWVLCFFKWVHFMHSLVMHLSFSFLFPFFDPSPLESMTSLECVGSFLYQWKPHSLNTQRHRLIDGPTVMSHLRVSHIVYLTVSP